MKKYICVIFDLDGTLLDTSEGVINAVHKTVSDLNLKKLEENVIKRFVGPPMQESFKKYYNMNDRDALKSANLFRENYKNNSLFLAKLYPQCIEMLKWFHQNGYKLAVATNKSHRNAQEILDYFGIIRYCDYFKGSDLDGILKKSDIINDCLIHLSVSPDEVVYIGDSSYDAIGAEIASIDFIAVNYGFGFGKNEDVKQYNHIALCNSPTDIISLFDRR